MSGILAHIHTTKHQISPSDFKILSTATSEADLLIRESLFVSKLNLILNANISHRKVMGGWGFSKRQYIFFCTPIEEIFFFSLDGWKNFFFIKIYRPIFQGRNFFFCTMPGKIFFF